ncbi:MAG: SPOR domain-containing protein [Algiphilus sp.]|uniref:SPOR domain-containing protein n=1 Tax=Algiphilus sp. TaxID=1872431 RepID=UPI0032ED83FA
MHESEAIALRNRLIGAGALCLLVFILSLFIPEPGAQTQDQGMVIDLAADSSDPRETGNGGTPSPVETPPVSSAPAQATAENEARPATPPAAARTPSPAPAQKAPRKTAEAAAPAAPSPTATTPRDPAASSTAATAPTPPATAGRWWIQAASYSDPAMAQAGKQRAEKRGFYARLKEVRIDGKAWWRLQIGPYGNASAAEAAVDDVEAAGFGGARAIER